MLILNTIILTTNVFNTTILILSILNTSCKVKSLPERRLQFEEFLSSLGSFRHVISQHANSEELTHIPVVIHFLQGTFATQKTVQSHT